MRRRDIRAAKREHNTARWRDVWAPLTPANDEQHDADMAPPAEPEAGDDEKSTTEGKPT